MQGYKDTEDLRQSVHGAGDDDPMTFCRFSRLRAGLGGGRPTATSRNLKSFPVHMSPSQVNVDGNLIGTGEMWCAPSKSKRSVRATYRSSGKSALVQEPSRCEVRGARCKVCRYVGMYFILRSYFVGSIWVCLGQLGPAWGWRSMANRGKDSGGPGHMSFVGSIRVYVRYEPR